MKKVKFICDFDLQEVEKEVNSFIKDKEIINIKYSTTPYKSAFDADIHHSVMIVYKEEE